MELYYFTVFAKKTSRIGRLGLMAQNTMANIRVRSEYTNPTAVLAFQYK